MSKPRGTKMSNYKEQYVNVLDIKFYVCDEDGNEVLNKDGTIKEYYLTYKANKGLDWFVEGLEPTDLEEIKDEV